MEFDDYPETVYENLDIINDENFESHVDSYKYVDNIVELEKNTRRLNKAKGLSLSDGDILESVKYDHYEFVKNRFERTLPEYEIACKENGLNLFNPIQREEYVRVIKIEDRDDSSDGSTLKLSDSDEETEV